VSGGIPFKHALPGLDENSKVHFQPINLFEDIPDSNSIFDYDQEIGYRLNARNFGYPESSK
jgi:hypothetical protein